MTDETMELIEESNDEIDNWIHYSNKTETQDSTEANSFIDVDSEQQLIYIDPTDIVENENKHTLQYDCDDDDEGGDQVVEQFQQAECDVDSTNEHNLILKETIDENGKLVEQYYCKQCNMLFNSIEEFFGYHPLYELLNENSEEQVKVQIQQQQDDTVTTVIEDRLWTLVEDLDETEDNVIEEEDIEIKPNIAQQHDEMDDFNNSVEMDKERYFCYDCKQVFTDLTTAENHDCNIPLQNSSDFSETNSTIIPDSDVNMYRCHLCHKDYTSLRSFNNHQRLHKNFIGHSKTVRDERTVCEICNTIFASEKNLKLHMKMHKKHTVKTIQEALPVGAQNEYNDLNQFFCEICNKSFDQKLLVIHKNMHQNLEEYICGKCNKKFENLPSYEIHMQMHLDNVKRGNTSKNFNKNFAVDAASTSAQGFIDTSKRKHACQYCGKEFQRPYEKVKHERIHTGEKPYECEVCGKTFRVSYSLTLHLRTHTDIRPYVCATCNKRFKQQSVYVHHLKTHEVECAYRCDICGKSFRTSVQLSGHKNIHSKPYNCTECNRPFASLYAVKIHMKTHNKCHKSNKNLKNRCSICGACYARVVALSVHMKDQHGISVDPARLWAAASGNTGSQNQIEAEKALLINVADEASNQQLHFLNADDESHEYNDLSNEGDVVFGNQVDHEENVQNSLPSNVYMDETEAATQAILNTEEISVDNFPSEEIGTDWLSK